MSNLASSGPNGCDTTITVMTRIVRITAALTILLTTVRMLIIVVVIMTMVIAVQLLILCDNNDRTYI